MKPARQSIVIPLPVEDEWPHPPGDEWDWQESVVLCFQDLHHRVGGFIRIGHHPNRNTGNLTFGVVTPEGNADGIPNVLTEAMAAGLPVISTRVSGIPELVDDGVSGRIVEQRDAAALADAIAALLADPALRDAYAAAGRAKVEREFDVRIEAGRLFDCFVKVARG